MQKIQNAHTAGEPRHNTKTNKKKTLVKYGSGLTKPTKDAHAHIHSKAAATICGSKKGKYANKQKKTKKIEKQKKKEPHYMRGARTICAGLKMKKNRKKETRNLIS